MAKKQGIKCWQIHMSPKTCSEYWGGRERDNNIRPKILNTEREYDKVREMWGLGLLTDS